MGIRRKRKDEYHHGDLRRALLDGALALIDEDGLGAVSTRALARRLGVSHAAPAHHFKDREALLAEVATEGFGHFTAALEEVSQRCEDRALRVAEIGKAYVGFAVKHPAYFRVMFGRGALDYHQPTGPLKGLSEASFQVLRVAVAALASGAKAAEVDELSFTAWSLVHGLAMLWLDGAARLLFHNRTQFEAATERVIQRALRGLVPAD